MKHHSHKIPMIMSPFPIMNPPRKMPKSIPPDLGNFVLDPPKPCPLCSTTRYHYKHYWGLLRHVQRDHLVDANGKVIEWIRGTDVKALRKYSIPYVKVMDIPVKNYEYAEKLVYHYCMDDWNPSLRGFG